VRSTSPRPNIGHFQKGFSGGRCPTRHFFLFGESRIPILEFNSYPFGVEKCISVKAPPPPNSEAFSFGRLSVGVRILTGITFEFSLYLSSNMRFGTFWKERRTNDCVLTPPQYRAKGFSPNFLRMLFFLIVLAREKWQVCRVDSDRPASKANEKLCLAGPDLGQRSVSAVNLETSRFELWSILLKSSQVSRQFPEI
jgi:hypothetical protein